MNDLHQLSWIKPTYLGIQWPQTQTFPAPSVEIDMNEFLRLMFCATYTLCGTNFSQTFIKEEDRQSCNLGGLWTMHYYFYPDYAVAVGERYESAEKWDANQKKYVPKKLADADTFLGAIVPREDRRHANILRFWRIGCQHKNMKHSSPRMFDQVWDCPDCGYHVCHDSSG
jgi:hypothetical protein